MKKIITILLLLVTLGLTAQNYNNEWIDYSKTYYKFKVGTTGLYRIPQSVLAGANLGSVPAENFQLFRNGKEVPIYTSVSSGPIGSGGYIEFWGEANDGVPDKPLYRDPSYQQTDHTSLQTDTATFFLTVNNSGGTFHFTNATNDTLGTSLSVEPYLMYTSGSYFRSGRINPGFAQIVGEYIYSSSYDLGEGWATGYIYPGTPATDVQSNLFVYSPGPDAYLRFGMAGCADNSRNVRVTLNNSLLIDTIMNSFYDLQTGRSVPISLLSSSTANVQFANNSGNSTDRAVASFYELTYPRQWNFGGQSNFKFELPAKSNGYFLKINNLANAGGQTPILYDLTNGQRYAAITGPGTTLSFLLPGSSQARKLVLVNEDPATVNAVTGFTVRNFTNYTNTANQGNYLLISSPLLYTGTSGNNPILDYKNYRSSVAGGGFAAQNYDIDELVDQFAFGIKKHPLSIQNFLRYARANFSIKPQYVLLIGHGMTYNDYNYYAETMHDPLVDRLNMIPTFGYPGSDNKLSSADGANPIAVTPIGRISAINGAEVENYLSKVKDFENVQATTPNTLDGRMWMKNVLHLTGVSEPYLGTIICNYMYAYQQIIADTLIGANVTTLCDGNAGSVNQVPGGVVSKMFNTGFSILNYFGHSSNTALGYNLDNPSAYNNQGKYPMFYLNGCDAGDFFVYDAGRTAATKTISENYVLVKDRGAISVIASTHFGIVNYLNILLYNLYNIMSTKDYGKSIGITEQDALQALVNVSPGDYFARLHAEQMTLHGDPALRFNTASLPDYDVEASQVVVNPSFISVSDASFTMKARFYNLGKATADSVNVQVTRKYPDGSSALVLSKRLPAFAYDDSISLLIPIVATRDKGQNFLTVSINYDNAFPEVTTVNNSTTVSVYVYEDEANPIYPYNFSIINTPTSKLYASTADPFTVSSQYVMEIDTTTLFNSSFKISKTVTSAGGLLEFDPGITYGDSVVYYWRVSKVPGAGGTYKWNDFSFTYIDPAHSSTGFNQSHFFQHTESTLEGLVEDTASRKMNFVLIDNILQAKCGTFPLSAPVAADLGVVINGDPTKIQSTCGVGILLFTVFDPYTFKPWYNAPTGQPGRYKSLSPCGPTRENYFIYNMMDTASRRAAVAFMDLIPKDFYVICFNSAYSYPGLDSYAATWKGDTSYLGSGNSVYQRLFDQGFIGIDSFYKSRAFIFMYQKNNPANFAPRFVLSKDATDKINLTATYHTVDTVGYITSPQLGPAKKWNNVHWRGSNLESPSYDSATVQVIGIDTLGNSVVLHTLGFTDQDYDIGDIDEKLYRYVKLRMRTTDTAAGTPYQLKYWRVNYDPIPEGALAPNIYLQAKDTLALGEKMDFSIAFKNVSAVKFPDSLALKMTITDNNNVAHIINLPRKKPLISGDTVTVSYQIDTKGYGGNNTIFLNVNPDNAQPEQYLFNNFLYKKFYVATESRNPTLDVTFDNVHILNDDIVSAKPHIQIKLKSSSEYLLLTDTSTITLQLKFPDGSIRTYGFNSDTLRFTPASAGNNNVATVDFNPVFLQQYNASGDSYQLIVTGKDAIGNQAGTIPYRVSFKIITKPMISNLLNYPNPFTTSTAFVFTITGSEVPQNIKIQILTITGKIVREITKDELGPLHIGRNITDFKWDGKDMYGQRLANGVYLYHVVTNLNGRSLDKYKAAGDNTDKYFNNGYGKMYLMK